MKRSHKITLVLISSISLLATGCSSQQTTKRELYQTKEDCAGDWGNPSYCQPTDPNNSMSYFTGPDYYYSGGRVNYFPPGTDRAQQLAPNANFALAHQQEIAATQSSKSGSGGNNSNNNWSSSTGTSGDNQPRSKSIGQIETTKTISRGGFGKSGSSFFGRGS